MAKRAKVGQATADISVQLFMIAARFVAEESKVKNEPPETARLRGAISGVYVQRHPKSGILLVGTDGHRMMVLHDEYGKCSRSMTLDVKVGLKVARGAKPSTDKAETRWRVRDGGKKRKGESRVPLIGDQYPDWLKIPSLISVTRGGAVAAFNPKYIADFTRVAQHIQPHDKHPQIAFALGNSPSQPLLVLFPGQPNVFGVIMPMAYSDDPGLPKFILPMLSAKTKAAKPA